MRLVHAVVPAGLDDPQRPSGGNFYDRQLMAQLPRLGWTVREWPVGGTWPDPDDADLTRLLATLRAIPDQAVVLVDGLIASAAGHTLADESQRLRLVVLMHMPLDRPAEVAALTSARVVVATSEWTARRLSGTHGLANVVVAQPGVEPGSAALGTHHGGSWLSVGAVTSLKGQDLVVSALERLQELPWSWTVVGALDVEPEFATTLRTQVERAGLASRITFTGPLPHDELASVYTAADLLIHASRAESYGMAVTEAQAHGVPALATAVGGLPETVAGAGRLVPPEDPAALADALAAWLADEQVRRELRAAARHRAAGLPSWLETGRLVASALGEVAR